MPRHRKTRVRKYIRKASIAGGAAATATALAMSIAVPPANAVTIPGIGEIPGTEGIPLDVGALLTGFGGGVYVEAAEALADGDILRLLNALDQHEEGEDSQLVDTLKAIQDGDVEGLVRELGGDVYVDAAKAIQEGDVKGLVSALGGGVYVDAAEAIQEGDIDGLITAFGGGIYVRYKDAIQEGDWLALLDALDADADGDGQDSNLREFVMAVQAGDWVAAAVAFGAGPILDLLALGGITPDTLTGLTGLLSSGGQQADTSAALLKTSELSLPADLPITSTGDTASHSVTVEQEQPELPTDEKDADPSADALVKHGPLRDLWRGTLAPSDDGNGPVRTAVKNTRQRVSDAVSGTVDRLSGAVSRVTKSVTGGRHSAGGDAAGGGGGAQ